MPIHRWLQFRLRWLLAIPLLIGGAMTAAYYWPRHTHWLDLREVTGHYRGLGVVDDSGFLGKNFYRIEVRFDGLRLVAEFDRPGYNPFKMYYPDGQLAAEGVCFVEENGFNRPLVVIEATQQGKFYRPDGTLDGEVVDGTGVQRIWTPEGTLTWETHLKVGQAEAVSMWYPNGQLSTAVKYVSGKEHGLRRSYFPSGKLQCEGEMVKGERVGTWTWYHEDGMVERQETY